MSTIFPLSASVGQIFQGYQYDGTLWNIIGIDLTADYPEIIDGKISASVIPNDFATVAYVDQEIGNIDLSPYLTLSSASSTYLTQANASITYATKVELQNIDLSSASAAAVAAIVDSAPETLNTLNELAAALGDDANYASTVTTALGNKLDSSAASTTYLTKESASNTYLTSASMQTVPVYVMNSGSSAQRPSPASNGMFRFNTTTGYPEWYDAATNNWWNFYDRKQFDVEYLVVAGGGGGGYRGGGGGGGGYAQSSTISTAVGTGYQVTVGAGGANSTNGSNSVFRTITSFGGGAGGWESSQLGKNGGCGGGGGGGYGSGNTTVPGGTGSQGGNGGSSNQITGYYGGGGGGSTGNGGNGVANSYGGAGGSGLTSTISSVSVTYGGGGGGNSWDTSNVGVGSGGGGNGGYQDFPPTAGAVNRGGGGGGGGYGSGAGTGGSGVVILSYPNNYPLIATISPGLTYNYSTARAGYHTYRFTAGEGTVIW